MRSWSAATPPTATAPSSRACLTAGARFSLVLVKNPTVTTAIATIPDDAWIAGALPGRGARPRHRRADQRRRGRRGTEFTAFASTKHPVTARLIVRRVRDRARLDELFPVWRHHPFFTNSTEPDREADVTHRRHAIIETVFADLIDGPLAHLPSGRFAANSAWTTLRGDHPQPAPRRRHPRRPRPGRGPRRDPAPHHHHRARPARPAPAPPVLHLPAHWPWAKPWLTLWDRVLGDGLPPPVAA